MNFFQENCPDEVDTKSLDEKMLILTQLFKEVPTVHFLDIAELLQTLLYEMLRYESAFSPYSFKKLVFFFLFSIFFIYSVLKSMASLENIYISFA